MKRNFVFLDHTFPDPAVVEGYTRPQVDSSLEPFSWGRPDVEGLRSYCTFHFGWPPERTSSFLQPLLQEQATMVQRRMDTYLRGDATVARIRSKRLLRAVLGMTNQESEVCPCTNTPLCFSSFF